MKLETKITEMTHDDLVLLLSTATEGCGWLEITMPQGSYKGTSLKMTGCNSTYPKPKHSCSTSSSERKSTGNEKYFSTNVKS